MRNQSKNSLTRIGVFYDGNYFLHVSNYYNYTHEKRSRVSINGLHEFIRRHVAELESSEYRLCQIVDAHYFRGRLSAGEASQRGDLLYYERVFDDILMSEGVTTHYLPVRTAFGKRYEKGIDVWLALEAFELAFYKQFDVLVLIAGDGDYVPLARKLNTLGTRVMVLGWEFESTDEDGNRFNTHTSQYLLDEVTYPIAMHEIINAPNRKNDAMVSGLFVPRAKTKTFLKQSEDPVQEEPAPVPEVVEPPKSVIALPKPIEVEPQVPVVVLVDGERQESNIMTLKEGFGFIRFPPNNVFFHYTSLRDYDFNDLAIGDRVAFTVETKDNGRVVALEVVVLD